VRRAVVPLVAVAVVAAVIVFEVASSGPEANAKPAPPLPPTVLQGPRATLAGLRGKPALINFWASWCEPCREEAPELERFDRSPHGGQLVGVDYTDRAGPARDFVRQYHWRFPVLEDPDGVYGARYHLNGLPTTVVLDSRGRIVETLRGPQSVADLRRALIAAGEADART
jgi:cytochrome c biogenesis protein CcmG/thiol:disulfide interchange protein DsbE